MKLLNRENQLRLERLKARQRKQQNRRELQSAILSDVKNLFFSAKKKVEEKVPTANQFVSTMEKQAEEMLDSIPQKKKTDVGRMALIALSAGLVGMAFVFAFRKKKK